jgi:hypothetical protein
MAYTTRTAFHVGRDARTGRFVAIRIARENPSTTVIELIRVKPPNRIKSTRRR